MEFGAASDAIVQFSGQAAGTLYLHDVAHFTGSVTGFGLGDTIDLAGIDPAEVSVDNSGHLEIHYGTGAEDFFSISGNYDPAGFTVATDHNGGTDIIWNDQASVIDADQVSLVHNSDGTTMIAGLHLLDSVSAATTETFAVSATSGTAGASVNLATSSGHLSDVNIALDDFTYDPGVAAPSTASVAITVADSLGATDKVNFIFNDGLATTPLLLQGTAGKDVIFGSAHGDVLTGGGGQDQFVFAPSSGTMNAQHTITDFVPGLDKINISQFGNPGSFSDLSEIQQGNDTLITLDSHDSLLLKNVGAVNLSANDFILHPGSHA
jgi:Ca2+-binding RTX toxin-like protein